MIRCTVIPLNSSDQSIVHSLINESRDPREAMWSIRNFLSQRKSPESKKIPETLKKSKKDSDPNSVAAI